MKLIIALAVLSGCLTPVKDDGDSGLAGEPDIDVTPASLDFGTVFQLSESTASINISNVGDAELTGELSLGAGAPFSLGSTSFTLAAGEDVDVDVVVYPEDFGAFSDTITISANDPDEPVTVVTLSASVDADGDGDGYGPGEDCDDTNPDVYPGAEDDWYDGVDADCEGDDDYDADADGHQSDAYDGDDCDDSDPDAYPGNEETWYDGVDGDCDGRNDNDADGDGYEFDGAGGDDCDDTNPDVNPGTLENAEDGIDNDCDSAVDEDLSGDDLDGDGYSELDGDCNDADASISPAATETWYDGTDQDCDGASDFDADVDGFDSDAYGGDDCDDADAGVNPDAAETYYDGVDTNCDGQNDYDADGDGHASDSYGGDDCDDLNSLVSPSAAEVWYDGTDQDCAGDDDYDADADGYQSDAHGGDDCDDNEASAYPGGSDTWYDGIDGDCAGDSDYDADLDGEDSDAYGGADCDDGDAAINTSAEELCDGVDTDCSGVDDDDYATDAATWYADSDADGYGDAASTTGACDQPSGYVSDDTDCDDADATANPGAAEVAYDGLDNDCSGAVDDSIVSDVQVYEVYGASANDGLASSLLVTPDLNGDSDPELIIASELDSNYGSSIGLVGLFDADSVPSSGSVFDGYSTPYGSVAGDYFGHAMIYLGDLNSDNSPEVAVSAIYNDDNLNNAGTVYILSFGAGSTHESGAATVSADGELYGTQSSEQFGASISAGDVDGDGLTDLGVGGPGYSGGRGRVYVSLASDGYATAADVANAYSSVYVYGPSSTAGLGTALDIGADLDGDGYGDIIGCGGFNNSNNGRCWIIQGANGLSIRDYPIQNYDLATIGGQNAEEIGMGQHSLATSDVDGDGQADILIGAEQADSGNGAVYVFFGSSSLSGNYVTQSDEDITISGDGALGASIQVGSDIDGDGTIDHLFGAPTGGDSGEGAAYLLSGNLSAGSYTLPDDQAASWLGASAGDEFGSVISGSIDLEGDGQQEFAIAAPGSDNGANNRGSVYVVPTY